jgi:hypothetical protein
LIPGKQQNNGPSAWQAVFAALFVFAAGVAACSGLAASDEAPPALPDPAYQRDVADYFRTQFKDYSSYDSYEISEPRWVHSIHGWSWLTCVRFQDHGRRRNYALYLQSGKIVDGRYAIETDACEAQAYAPFALMTGGGLQPLH